MFISVKYGSMADLYHNTSIYSEDVQLKSV